MGCSLRRWVMLGCLVYLMGCQPQYSVSRQTVQIPTEGSPHQVVTYDDKRVMHPEVTYEDGEVYRASKVVYVDSNSQFVYRNGEPILYLGQPVYWNADGYVVTPELNIIPKHAIFSVEGSPLRDTVALTIKTPFVQAKANLNAQKAAASPR